jgi:RimJ/RimL family protein N-acetyltransferase
VTGDPAKGGERGRAQVNANGPGFRACDSDSDGGDPDSRTDTGTSDTGTSVTKTSGTSASGASPTTTGTPGEGEADDTLDLALSDELTRLLAEHGRYEEPQPAPEHGGPGSSPHGRALAHGGAPAHGPASAHGPAADLLGSVGDWPTTASPVGTLRLVPVVMDRDLRLITAWMNDPAVAAYWELAGPQEVTAAHLRTQLEGDGRSVPCLGVLDGVPMSYWEVYRADLDPIARHCRALPHDTGLHLLIGSVPDRGRGVGTALLRAVADLVLDRRPDCGRVLAEPDVRNVASVAAFLKAGFRLSAEVDLPGKRAALMVRDRALREVL